MARSAANITLDNEILRTLQSGPLSTTALADILCKGKALTDYLRKGATPAEAVRKCKAKISRRCRWLEDHGLLQSTLEQGARLFFCGDHDTVVTADIYPDCKAEGHDLFPFFNEVRVWRLTARGRNAIEQ